MAANIEPNLSVFEQTLLELSPSLCVKPQEQETCEIELTMTVNIEDSNGFCLVSSDVDIKVCVNESSELFTHSIQVNANKSVIIALTNLDGSEIWATEKLVVAEFSPSKTRRRRNLGWIF